MFRLIKKIFIGLLAGLVNWSNHTNCVSVSCQKCMIQPTLINLHPNEHNQEFCYNTFTVKLDRCAGSCNTLDDLSNKVCLSNKTEDFKSKRLQHDYRIKWIENINKACIIRR